MERITRVLAELKKDVVVEARPERGTAYTAALGQPRDRMKRP
jgi:hypothetical protein